MAHTSGPWGYVYDGSSVWSVGRDDDPQDRRIASVQKCSSGEEGWHEAAANACLIAAAPDLLSACQLALVRLDDGTEVSQKIADHVRAAIAKAHSGAPEGGH